MTASALSEKLKGELQRRGLTAAVSKERYSEWCPWFPHPKQETFLMCAARFVLFGGAVGGGKSVASLMDALKYVHIPGYRALILRRTVADLKKAGALLDMAHQWLRGTRAKWEGSAMRYVFPSGATIEFGGCDDENATRKYFSGSWARIYVEEAQQFPWPWLAKIMTRLRRPIGVDVPVAFRATGNPVDIGKLALREHFVESNDPEWVYIPSKLEDNPSLDTEEYEASLAAVDVVTRQALRHGDWYAAVAGKYATPEMFQILEPWDVPDHVWSARFTDISLTGEGDACASGRMTVVGEKVILLDAFAMPLDTPRVRSHLLNWAESDPRHTVYGIDNEGASMTIIQEMEGREEFWPLDWKNNDAWLRLPGEEFNKRRAKKLAFTRVSLTSHKLNRASGVLEALHDGRFYMVRAPWNQKVIDQWTGWEGSVDKNEMDDIIDMTTGCYAIARRLPQPKDSRSEEKAAVEAVSNVVLPGTKEFEDARKRFRRISA